MGAGGAEAAFGLTLRLSRNGRRVRATLARRHGAQCRGGRRIQGGRSLRPGGQSRTTELRALQGPVAVSRCRGGPRGRARHAGRDRLPAPAGAHAPRQAGCAR